MIRADDRRIPGWRALREYLQVYRDEQGVDTAKLQIFNTCSNIIRTLPMLIHDPHDPEDVDDHCEDHGPESVRYGIMSRPVAGVDDKERKQRMWTRRRQTQPTVSVITGY